jgi:hypothetical protein
MRLPLALSCLVTASCASPVAIETSSPPATRAVEVSPPATAPIEPEDHRAAFERARELFAVHEVRRQWISDDDARALVQAGLDAATVRGALGVAVDACGDGETCALPTEEHHVVEGLIGMARHEGAIDTVPALLALDRLGFHGDSAVDDILARHAAAEHRACAPPDASAIATARAGLDDFVVVDRRDGRLVARRPSPAELDDLAYFYAGIADAGPGVGEGAAPTPLVRRAMDDVASAARRDHLQGLADALEAADLERAQTSAVAYLTSLGYPGPIDPSRETDMTWGGARYSYVMRDLALISEIVGEVDIAADLYRRANPGGGACGTSVDYRRGRQLRGLIRSEERAGHCRAVVAQRLLDWDNEYDPGRERDPGVYATYGPGRLVAAGWDAERMYRGALLTRNRDVEVSVLEAAFADAPGALASDGMRRLERENVEDWEFRVRALEGLADTAGRDALGELTALLDVGSDALRERTVGAIGAMAQRHHAGPCPEGLGGFGFGSMSSSWSRQVSAFSTSCPTQLDDDAANALADRLIRFSRAQPARVRDATIRAVAKLAAPASRRALRRFASQATAAVERACDGVDLSVWSPECDEARNFAEATSTAWDHWSNIVDGSP